LRIERVGWPAWARDAESERIEASRAALGDQATFGVAIPQVFRALAAPSIPTDFIRLTDASAFSYWTALLHLLVFSFGWSRPDLGLATWYFGDRPTDDDRFALVDAVWLADDRLDEFVAQLIAMQAHMPNDGYLEKLAGLGGASSPRVATDAQRSRIPDGFVETVRERVHGQGRPSTSPLGGDGGWDPLHLGRHIEVPLHEAGEVDGSTDVIVVDASRRSAALLLGSMIGWYRILCERGATLPDVGDRSWSVDVHVRPVGFLGTFRRSRVSGLWFAGPHRYHVWGIGGA
jgi:hypothetical protein